MRTDRLAKESFPIAPSQRRRTLSNITNLSLSASWASESREGLVKSASGKNSGGEVQLREENGALKRLLSEKEAAIEKQARHLDLMQKEFFIQLRRQTQVNEELISYNSRLSREGGNLRDQLKLLQHEYCQMTVAYRISQSELQAKLTESQELLTRLLQQAERNSPTDTDPLGAGRVPRKPRSSSAHRRHSSASLIIEDDWNSSTRFDSKKLEEGLKRSESRRSSSVGLPSREPTTRSRQAQHQAENPAAATPYRPQHTNLYSDLIGLEPMQEESCEGDSARELTSVSSSNTSDDSCHSGLASESHSSRRLSGSDAGSATSNGVKRAAQALSTNKINQRVAPVAAVSSSVPAPHFSRRVSCNSLNTTTTGSGRPVRRAVEKVSSYTEPSLHTKMRRPS